jgi:LacI family transcriptional regulator
MARDLQTTVPPAGPALAASRGRAGRRITLASIAEQAGVSMATVSKVLNGRADVAADTRARIQQLLSDQNYLPLQRNTSTVDLIFSDLDSPWAVEILRGVESNLTNRGMAVVVSSVQRHGSTRPPSWTRTIARHHSAGVLLVMSQLTARQWRELQQHDTPLVVIDPADIPGPEVPSVGATNWSGGIAATEHLLQLGPRRIGMISGPQEYLCSRARVDGYRHALEQAGIDFDTDLVRWGDFRQEGGFRWALELLDQPNRPTAIFGGSDEQTLGSYEAARQLGLAIPGDLSVVGFDDLPLARWLPPPLTTVRQPLADMGAMAADMLLRLIAGRDLASRRVELATELVVRESTAPPAG